MNCTCESVPCTCGGRVNQADLSMSNAQFAQAQVGAYWQSPQTTTAPSATTNYGKPPPGRKVVDLMPPLLQERIEHLGIVMPAGAPVFDRVIVWPLTDADSEQKTAGGLYLADGTKRTLVAQMGVVIRAGARALEQLYSHGIELGHIVMLAAVSPWKRKYMAGGKPYEVLLLRASEVAWSDDLQNDLAEGRVHYERDHDGRVELADRERLDPTTFEGEET